MNVNLNGWVIQPFPCQFHPKASAPPPAPCGSKEAWPGGDHEVPAEELHAAGGREGEGVDHCPGLEAVGRPRARAGG